MTVYTNTITDDTTLTVSIVAVTWPVRLLSASGGWWLPGSTAVREFSAYVVPSPTFSGTTNFTALPTRQNAPAASILVRVNGTQSGTATRFGYAAFTTGGLGVVKPDVDIVIAPGSAIRLVMDAAGGTPVTHVTFFVEELRQLSWPL